MSTKDNYTFDDMLEAFSVWRDMRRNGPYLNMEKINQAWQNYTKIRDALGWKPFPVRASAGEGAELVH